MITQIGTSKTTILVFHYYFFCLLNCFCMFGQTLFATHVRFIKADVEITTNIKCIRSSLWLVAIYTEVAKATLLLETKCVRYCIWMFWVILVFNLVFLLLLLLVCVVMLGLFATTLGARKLGWTTDLSSHIHISNLHTNHQKGKHSYTMRQTVHIIQPFLFFFVLVAKYKCLISLFHFN